MSVFKLERDLQLFIGDASDAEARVYATLPRGDLLHDAQLTGELIGPHCRYSKTLPARIRFIDRGPGPTLLAEAVVADPCFWTPELPFMYSAELRLSGADAAGNPIAPVPAVQSRLCGIRRLGVHGTSIYLDAKRIVVRGIHIDTPRIEDLKAAREAASALYLEEPSDAFLQEASEEGALLAVGLGERMPQDKLIAELVRLGRWPAVALVVLDSDVPVGKELRLAVRNTLLAQRVAGAQVLPVGFCPWAHLLWWHVDIPVTAVTALPRHDLPIIVYRPRTKTATIFELRRACDRLQADVALLGDFAGYFV
jgi:hypothetical protein